MIFFLIGMMGSGKSTIGRGLALKLDYSFIDTDHLIEEMTSHKIKDIVNENGIDYFRTVESNTLRNLSVDINTVVSTGGGMILNPDNVMFMKSNGKVIYLEYSIESLLSNLKSTNTSDRPLLKDGLEVSLTSIYQERKELYEKASDITIPCDNLTVDEIIVDIINKLA